MILWLRYVCGPRIAEYEAAGWRRLGLDFVHHDYYSEIMEWTGEGDPPTSDDAPSSVNGRWTAAIRECEMAQHSGDKEAFNRAIVALGLCCWNLARAIEQAQA